MSTRKKLYSHIAKNGEGIYLGEDLRSLVEADDWARVLRQLRQNGILEFDYNRKEKHYDIKKIHKFSVPTKRTGLSSKDKYRIRHRDGHKCQSCGKSVKDGVKLKIKYKTLLKNGGTKLDNNLWTICSNCTLQRNTYKLICFALQEKTAIQRLKVLFESMPNTNLLASLISNVAKINNWQNTISTLRQKYSINIKWLRPNSKSSSAYYRNIE